VFILLIGVALTAWNWHSVVANHEFEMNVGLLGPFVVVYGVAHAIKARELRVLGEPRWAKAAYAIGIGVAAVNWYLMCHAICATCGLRDCFEWWR
jgi:hypothetical protein